MYRHYLAAAALATFLAPPVQAQLHDAEDIGQGLHAFRVDAERRTLRLRRHECADPLARDHQALGPQRGNRLAHHGPADARGARQRLLGRQALAGREPPALDLLGELLEQAARKLAGRSERADAHHVDGGLLRGEMQLYDD